MKFPLLLSLDLLRSRASRMFAGARNGGLIQHVSPAAFAVQRASFVEATSVVRNVYAPPVLWIGGEEPLQHPLIGRVAGELTAARKNVFLHTIGVNVRQRIHEFRPDDRLFLTIELAGREKAHDAAVGQSGAFARSMEGIRAAKLSGFHVCAHVTADAASDVCEVGELFELLDSYDVDGYIVSSGGRLTASAERADAQRRVDEIRALVRCSRWEFFSTLLESSYAVPRGEKAGVAIPGSDSGACEESA